MPFCQTWQNKHTSIQVSQVYVYKYLYMYIYMHTAHLQYYTVTCSINKLRTAHRQHFSISFLGSMAAMPLCQDITCRSWSLISEINLHRTSSHSLCQRPKRTALTPTRKTAQMPLIFHGKTGNDHRGTFFAKGLYTAARSAGSSSCEDVPLPLWLGRHHRCLVFYTAGPMVPTCLERGFMECYTVTDITS